MIPTYELAHELITYDPIEGKAFWKERLPKHFPVTTLHTPEHACKIWNTRYAGLRCGILNDNRGYHKICFLGTKYGAHRVFWLYMTGEWPDEIDHINGIRTDNRMVNLRNVTPGINRKNLKRATNNTSGVTGVYFHNKNQKWVAQIQVNGKMKYLGSFVGLEEAKEVRKNYSLTQDFHANHGERDA